MSDYDYEPRDRPPQARACTNCGAPLPPGAEYCPECGHPVRSSRTAPWLLGLVAFVIGALLAFIITYAATSGSTTVTEHARPAKTAGTSSTKTGETVTAHKTVTQPASTVTSTTTATSTTTTTTTSTTTATTTTSSSST